MIFGPGSKDQIIDKSSCIHCFVMKSEPPKIMSPEELIARIAKAKEESEPRRKALEEQMKVSPDLLSKRFTV